MNRSYTEFLEFFKKANRANRQEMINNLQQNHYKLNDNRKQDLEEKVKGFFVHKALQGGSGFFLVNQIYYRNTWFSFETTETQIHFWTEPLPKYSLRSGTLIHKISAGNDDSKLGDKIETALNKILTQQVLSE